MESDLGIGTQTFLRMNPTRPSTNPFSFPDAGLQKRASNP